MADSELVRKVRDAFHEDAAAPPALTLRGGNAVDGYDAAEPFDPGADAPTDAYLERYAFWALPYLDARSWRHYLTRLVEYALDHPDDPSMVVEATVRSLRPPDRVPPRLATLSPRQEAAIVAFLERLALADDARSVAAEARTALEEWWWPGATLRSARDGGAAPERIQYRETGGGRYRITLPTALAGGGVHPVPAEHRTVEQWRGTLFGDATVDVIVNVYDAAHRTWREAEESVTRWLSPRARGWVEVPGARRALRLDGSTYRYSPAEPERTIVVLADARKEIVVLTVRGTECEEVGAEMERWVGTFRVGGEWAVVSGEC